MKKRIIISESEKKTILGLYNLLKEDVTNDFKVGDTFLWDLKSIGQIELILINKIDSEYIHVTVTELYDSGEKKVWEGLYKIPQFEDFTKNNWSKIDKTEYDKIISDYDANQKSKNNGAEKQTTNNETKKDLDESITISGIVKQGTIDGKKGVVDAIVTIEEKDDENNSKSAETDGNGAFKVVLPYVGKYKVTVEKKGFQSYSKTFNFNDDVNFNIPLSPKKGIIPKIKRGVQNIIDKLKDYYDTRDPKEETAIVFAEYSEDREKELWEESESQQEYCRNFTEYYYNFIIETNGDTKNVEQANNRAPDDEKLNQAKNFIMFCKKQYGNKLFASSIETKRKFDKIFATLQNLPPKVKRYQI
jgi:hypothetical protein